jgi:hypothetical protein
MKKGPILTHSQVHNYNLIKVQRYDFIISFLNTLINYKWLKMKLMLILHFFTSNQTTNPYFQISKAHY